MIKLVALILVLVVNVPQSRADVRSEIIQINEGLFVNRQEVFSAADSRVYTPEFVSIFYDMNDYQPAWNNPLYIEQMITLLGQSGLEGLNPDDYHFSQLRTLREQYRNEPLQQDYIRAQFDILLTDGVLLYAKHLLEGKVDPRSLDSSWNYTRRDFVPEDVAESLLEAIDEESVAAVLDTLKPRAKFYAKMRDELRRYQELDDRQQFFEVPGDAAIRAGQTGDNVLLLRRRLKQLSYVEANSPESEFFDQQLERAVKRFQRDHSIDIDGIVGKQSFAVLNMTFRERIDRLRINMDRMRWVSQDVSDDFILVNIAGYELHYFRNQELVWETEVMTGSVETQTPIFQKRLRYLEFNPTWTPPRSIIQRSLFAKFRADPGYALAKNYRFYDRSGNTVDPYKIDWERYTGASLPYRVVQMPGPDNAMGQVKFMFPNRHAVYLHDTPAKALFSRTSRAFSAGCIRVKNPLELARLLLDDSENWSASQITNLVDSGKPKEVVDVPRAIDVLLMYWTVSPTQGGGVQFHPDIYQLDAGALEALDAPAGVISVTSH